MPSCNDLTLKKCKPCEGGVKPLIRAESLGLLKEVSGWKLSEDAKSIVREYVMKNFLSAVDLIQSIAKIAESENHHPDIHLTGYRFLKVELSTHAIGGLSENDFIVAAKVEMLPKALKG